MERNSFLIVAKATLANKEISTTAKLLLALLIDHRNRKTGQCNPRRVKLAAELGVSLATIRRALSELRAVGFITSKRQQYTNNYEIRDDRHSSKVYSSQQKGQNDPFASVSEGSKRPLQKGQNDPSLTLYEPYLLEQDGEAAAADRIQAAAAAAPTSGVLNGNPAPEAQAQKLVVELMPQHPEPGNLPKAVSEVRKLLAAKPGSETVEAIRRNHAIWRTHWATYVAGRFIPQLWRWIHDGDWEFPPAERKGQLRESFAEQRQREMKEHTEKIYRQYAELEMWDAIRENGGEAAVEVWREKIKTA
jgi:hypothetical protein